MGSTIGQTEAAKRWTRPARSFRYCTKRRGSARRPRISIVSVFAVTNEQFAQFSVRNKTFVNSFNIGFRGSIDPRRA